MNAISRYSLFRKEAIEHRDGRLHGDVHLAVPVRWHVIGVVLVTALLIATSFLAFASYARVEMVTGVIVLDRGVASIVATRPGIVYAIATSEGQQVKAGTPLVRIRAEEDMTTGGTAPERVLRAIQNQDSRLGKQANLVIDAAVAERARLSAQADGLSREVASLDLQIAAQQRLVELAEDEFREIQGVAGRGFISRRDLEGRESSLIVRRQQLAHLQQNRAAKQSAQAEAHRAAVQVGATAEAQAAGVQSDRAALAQQLAQAEAARGYSLTSPVAGTVTALTARVGQPARADQSLMMVLPEGAQPHAELYVPTTAAGFLRPGQDVRLSIDAFPIQRFGFVPGRIAHISGTTIPRASPEGNTIPVYLVRVELLRPYITAFGQKQPLLPGMVLTARIITDERSLLEWLFEPIYAVRDR